MSGKIVYLLIKELSIFFPIYKIAATYPIYAVFASFHTSALQEKSQEGLGEAPEIGGYKMCEASDMPTFMKEGGKGRSTLGLKMI